MEEYGEAVEGKGNAKVITRRRIVVFPGFIWIARAGRSEAAGTGRGDVIQDFGNGPALAAYG